MLSDDESLHVETSRIDLVGFLLLARLSRILHALQRSHKSGQVQDLDQDCQCRLQILELLKHMFDLGLLKVLLGPNESGGAALSGVCNHRFIIALVLVVCGLENKSGDFFEEGVRLVDDLFDNLGGFGGMETAGILQSVANLLEHGAEQGNIGGDDVNLMPGRNGPVANLEQSLG